MADIAQTRFRKPSTHRAEHGLSRLPLLGLMALAGVAVALIVYLLWPRWPGAEIGLGAPAFPVTVGGVAFNVPPAAVRVSVQRRPGAHERIDLAFLWPSLEPADPGTKAHPATPENVPAQRATTERMFVTLSAAGEALGPAERVRSIYPRYVAADPEAEPEGLLTLAFREGTPYQGEDLIYEPPANDGFLVRCTRDGPGPTRGICLYERRIEKADIVVRFPRNWLTDWRLVASKVNQLILGLRPRG